MKAIVFDCFGVLTTDGWGPFVQKYFAHDSSLEDAAHTLNKRCDAGLIDYDEFVATVAEMAQMTVYEAKEEMEQNVANAELLAYIRTLKPQYKIGMLSNAARNWLDQKFAPEDIALFDAIVLSCDIGVTKPDPRTYETVCDKLAVDPHEAVFIDDIERYVTGATDVGMRGVVYCNFSDMKLHLEAQLAAH